jgi:hypothetical protein
MGGVAMSDTLPLASLSSSLLARKGSAKPAMRPQAIVLGESQSQNFEDLGWNDMGEDVAHTAASSQNEHAVAGEVVAFPNSQIEAPTAPAERIVEEQREQIAREFASTTISSTPNAARPRALAGSTGRAAFTLRLDSERHLKLRLVCAVAHRSAQHIVTQALDEFLARQPQVETLSATVRN